MKLTGKMLFKVNSSLNDGLVINFEWKGNICDLSLTNTSDKDVKVGDLVLFGADMPFPINTRFYGEGYTMLAQYAGKSLDDFYLSGSYSDYNHYKLPKPEGLNQVYNIAIFYPECDQPLLVGFSSCFRFNGCIRFNTETLQMVLNCENITIYAGETIKLEQIYVEQGEENSIRNNLADAISKNHPRLDFPEVPTGWCSWLVYGPRITERNVYDNLNAIKEKNLDLKYIQIDDGYQAHWGDWLEVTDKFAGGAKQLCLDIKAQGFEPAIWVAPFAAEKNSKLFQEHPDWFVKNDAGEPLVSSDVTFGGWRCGPWYMLDATHPDAINYLKTVFRTMREEWKVKYYKLDANVWGAMPFGHRYDANATAVEAYRRGMAAILEATGYDSFILGCNAPMWPSIGAVHGMRITNDNSRNWGKFVHLIKECFPRNWQHKRFWINDPDTVLLQNKLVKVMGPDGKETFVEGPITRNEFIVNAAYTMASGGMVLSSDDISTLRDDNVEILKKMLPSVEVAADFDDNSYTVGKAKISDEKSIIYMFNLDDETKDIRVSLDKRYDVLDLFEDENLGICEGEIAFESFAPHYAKVLICKKV